MTNAFLRAAATAVFLLFLGTGWCAAEGPYSEVIEGQIPQEEAPEEEVPEEEIEEDFYGRDFPEEEVPDGEVLGEEVLGGQVEEELPEEGMPEEGAPEGSVLTLTPVEAARLLVEGGQFDEALQILRVLQQRELGSDLSVTFLLGLAAVGASQNPALEPDESEALLDEAIAAFRAMLIEQPELVRVRLELARAFFLKGEDGLSRQNFEQVLAGDPPEGVVTNVQSFLAQIRARRRWSLQAGFALAPDTNIGGASESKTILIDIGTLIPGLVGVYPFDYRPETLSSGIGVVAWTGGEYQYPLTNRLRLRAGADVSRREYKSSRFDWMHFSGHAGPRWFVGANSEVSLLATGQRTWSQNDRYYDAAGGRLEVARRFTRRLTGYGQVSWLERRYRNRSSTLDLNGPVADVSLTGYWVVTPTIRTNLGIGWSRDRPESLNRRHDSMWLRVGGELIFPRGYTLGASGEYRLTDYEHTGETGHPHFVITGEAREDRTQRVRLSLYNRALSWNGFSPQLSVVHEVRDSNSQVSGYKRTGGELQFVRLF